MIAPTHLDNFVNSAGNFYWFHGVIEDVADPLKLGRVRVRCIGYHTDDRGALPTSELPWALCLLPPTSASMAGVGQSATGLQAGSWVIGFFRDGLSAQDPIIMGSIASKSVTKPNKAMGFSDPSGVNPSVLGADIPVPAISGTTAAKATYKRELNLNYIVPVYPNNQAIKTRSGHVIEYDDTVGKERISLLHKDGGFIEMAPGGVINIAGSKINLVAPAIFQNIRTGTTGALSDAASIVITFEEPLPSANYVVVVGSIDSTNNFIPRAVPIDASSFTLTTYDADGHGSGTYVWVAVHASNNCQ